MRRVLMEDAGTTLVEQGPGVWLHGLHEVSSPFFFHPLPIPLVSIAQWRPPLSSSPTMSACYPTRKPMVVSERPAGQDPMSYTSPE